MARYVKKPIVVDAELAGKPMDIQTLEGVMHADAGDYIITGVKGEIYPCKPDVFWASYDYLGSAEQPFTFATIKVIELRKGEGEYDQFVVLISIGDAELSGAGRTATEALQEATGKLTGYLERHAPGTE